MNERSSRGPGRRVGRGQVLEAAIGMLEEADLADLLSFLGTRAVAEAADVQPATVHHHFANRDDNPKPNARLAAAVLEACIGTLGSPETTEDIVRLVESGSFDVHDVAALRAVASADLETLQEGRRQLVGILVAAVVAANDPAACSVLVRAYDDVLDRYCEVFQLLADHLGRRFDTDSGFTPETLAVLATALSDGLLLRHQFDPGRVSPEVFGETALRLFEAATLPSDDRRSSIDGVAERLLARPGGQRSSGSELDPAQRQRIVDAVRARYATGGVEAISVTAVAREAGVSRRTVISGFGDRSGLAAAVWAQFVPDLEHRLDRDRLREMPLARTVERHLHRVVDLCKASPQLTVLLLDGMIGQTIRSGAPTDDRPDDPRTSVPLPALLVPVFLDSPHLRPGLAGTPAEAKDLAATITYLTMVRASSRPQETTSETVHHIMDVVFDGILAREAG